MKKSILIWNLLLTAGIIFLVIKLYKQDKAPSPASSAAKTQESSVVYVNTDSLLENYPYFEDLKKQLEKKQDSIERIIEGKSKALESEIKSYQQRGASLSDSQRMTEEEKLYRKQQELVEFRKSLIDQLGNEEEKMMDSLHKNLSAALKEYNLNKNYHFIFGYQKGSGILLANDSLDITKEIISVLSLSKQ